MPQGLYAPLARITDPALRAALKLLLDRIGALEGQAGGIGQVTQPLTTHLDAGGNLVRSVSNPEAPTDAVNLRTLQAYVKAAVSGVLDAPPPVAPRPVVTPGTTPDTPTTPTTPTDPTDPGGPTGPNPDPSRWPTPQSVSGNIRVAGRTLRTPDGSIYRWKSATDFQLLKRYLDGEDITPILADRTGEGASMVRVLGMASNLFLLDPSAYPTYYTQLPSFADALATAGLDLEFVVFADAQLLDHFNELTEQRTHVRAVRDALVGKANVVLELCNEAFQNGVTPAAHTRPVGILSATGSGSDETPDLPPWDYATFHAPRDAEWPRKSHNAMEIANLLGRPVINDEPMGAAEVAIPGSRSDVPDDFYYFAAVGMLLAGGGTFHSTNGLTSVIWQPVQRACAQSFYAGINAIPTDITTATYTRGPLSDCPIQHDDAKALRTYARYTANTAVAVAVRPTGGWAAIPTGAWAITGQTGPGGCVVYLSR